MLQLTDDCLLYLSKFLDVSSYMNMLEVCKNFNNLFKNDKIIKCFNVGILGMNYTFDIHSIILGINSEQTCSINRPHFLQRSKERKIDKSIIFMDPKTLFISYDKVLKKDVDSINLFKLLAKYKTLEYIQTPSMGINLNDINNSEFTDTFRPDSPNPLFGLEFENKYIEDLFLYLIKKGANIDELDLRKRSLLMKDSVISSIKIYKLLIDKGLNVNHIDREGNSVLQTVLKNKKTSIRIIRCLLENGAKVDHINKLLNNDSPLNTLLRRYLTINDLKIVKLLIEYGANVNYVNNGGSIIYNLIFCSNIEKDLKIKFLDVLIDNGADIGYIDYRKESIIHKLVTKYKNNDKLIDFLISKRQL
uniref:F-box domain-containing protein n=1 Tax=viral metagenome TaxID=1070528 RepID=A0A6C0JSI4_9ZZZZ